MAEVEDYTAFGHLPDRPLLEIERSYKRLVIHLTDLEGRSVSANFNESDAEEIAGALERIYRNIRLA